MKKYFLQFAFLSIFFFSKVDAQVPGYHGKKLSLYYYGSFYPRVLSPGKFNNLSIYSSIFSPGINYRHNFDADFVVSKSNAVGLSFKTLQTGQSYTYHYQYTYFDPYYSYNSSIDQSYNLNLTSYFFTAYLKNFRFNRRGSIAPIGAYQKFEIGFGITKPEGKALAFRYNDYNGFDTAITVPFNSLRLKNVTSVAFIYSIGKQQIVANTFYIDYGLEFGIVPQVLSYVFYALDEGTGSYYYNSNEANRKDYASKTQLRLFQHMLLNVHLGVGIPIL